MRRLTHALRLLTALAFVSLPIAGTAAAQSHGDVPEPSGFRLDDYRKPVPATLAGSSGVLTADAARKLRDDGAIFIDVYPRAPKPLNLPATTVWREPPHRSIEGAVWLPNVGYGLLASQVTAYFESNLSRLTSGDPAKSVVFFCLRDCWMSWNAAKRAIAMGYASVYWFPEGTDAWEEQGYPVVTVTPVP